MADRSVDVSILMPVKNGWPFLPKAIDSVLSQRGVSLELIVIDDHSDDGSIDAIRKILDPRLRIISSPSRGIAAAFNAGLSVAKGRYVGRCDADDLYTPSRLCEQVDWLEPRHEYGAVCGAFAVMTPAGSLLTDLECGIAAENISCELSRGRVRTHFCTFLVRTEILRRLSGCRPFFQTGEDIDLQLRLGEVCEIGYEPKRRYLYRLHGDSITHRLGATTTQSYEALARRLQQQRLSGIRDDLEQELLAPAPPGEMTSDLPLSRQLQGILLGTAWKQHARGHWLKAILTGFRAGLSHPGNLTIWRSVGALMIKRAGRTNPVLPLIERASSNHAMLDWRIGENPEPARMAERGS